MPSPLHLHLQAATMFINENKLLCCVLTRLVICNCLWILFCSTSGHPHPCIFKLT